MRQARVAELVDAHDSKSCSARSVGSIPSTGTNALFLFCCLNVRSLLMTKSVLTPLKVVCSLRGRAGYAADRVLFYVVASQLLPVWQVPLKLQIVALVPVLIAE